MNSPKVEEARRRTAEPGQILNDGPVNPHDGRPRVGFVVQRCGLEVNGGAESLCLQLAQRMAAHWRTEIITTCALDYMTWDNFFEPGIEDVGPTAIRRFRVDQPRDVEYFNGVSAELAPRKKEATLADQEKWMRAQGPISTGLLQYLSRQHDTYDAFIFCGYLYATTYFGLPLVRDKAILAPFAHDEWTIYFPMWDRFFRQPRLFIFNTSAERDFLRKRFGNSSLSGPIIGIGIDAPPNVDAREFKARHGLTAPYLLYVGRVDESKGCRELFDYFIRWKREQGSPHKLVVIGSEVMPVPYHEDIVYLGFVDEAEKWAAMKGCDWLVMPSPHESLSMALLETWSVGRPGLVNGACTVLVRHCQESHGGVWYKSYREWRAALETVDAEQKVALGRQGEIYVHQRYSWNRVENSCCELLAQLLASKCRT